MIFTRKPKRMYCECCKASFTGVFELRIRKFKIVTVCPECECNMSPF